ncbi:hypothetical protein CVT24_009684 [Panaeolus cyanescens]|uniref:Uncharacterized protein n=1 Tax=Panaeolus cyanescens TaxID=181874 RepID=A0A409Y9N1_9AGAR|nr:hypothetical protein CVT24_009684 [Panaeolus cyanescens]
MKFNLATGTLAVLVTSAVAAPSPAPVEETQQVAAVQNEGELFGTLLTLGKLVLPKVIKAIASKPGMPKPGPEPKSVSALAPPLAIPLTPAAGASMGSASGSLAGGLPSDVNNKMITGDDDEDEEQKLVPESPAQPPKPLVPEPAGQVAQPIPRPPLPFPLRFPGRIRQ